MPAGNWYYTVNGERRGPVSEAELRQMAAQGSLAPSELVWTDGMKDWVPAAQASGLFAAGAAAPMAKVVPDAAPAAGEPPMARVVGTPPAGPPPTPVARLTSSAVAVEAKAAMTNTWAAFRVLAVDPLGNLAQTYKMLGPNKALRVGIVFGLIYVIVTFWLAYHSQTFTIGGTTVTISSEMTVKQAFKAILSGAIYVAALALGLLLARKLTHVQGEIHGDVYAAGVALVPMALAMLICSFLGAGDIPGVIRTLVTVTGTAMMVLLLYHSLRDLGGMATKFAIYAAPASVVLASFVTSIIETSSLFK
jgi:hypothetical protein